MTTLNQPPSVMSGEEAHAFWFDACVHGPLRPDWSDANQVAWNALAAEIARRAVEAERDGYDPLPHYSVAYLQAQLDAERARSAKLREALTFIRDHADSLTYASAVARQALETEERVNADSA